MEGSEATCDWCERSIKHPAGLEAGHGFCDECYWKTEPYEARPPWFANALAAIEKAISTSDFSECGRREANYTRSLRIGIRRAGGVTVTQPNTVRCYYTEMPSCPDLALATPFERLAIEVKFLDSGRTGQDLAKLQSGLGQCLLYCRGVDRRPKVRSFGNNPRYDEPTYRGAILVAIQRGEGPHTVRQIEVSRVQIDNRWVWIGSVRGVAAQKSPAKRRNGETRLASRRVA